MSPYEKLASARLLRLLVTCSLVVGLANTGIAAQASQPSAAQSAAEGEPPEAITRAGLDDYYNTNYDAAVRAFQRVTKLRPDDPAAWNHLLAAILFRELYHAGALNSTLYSGNSFLNARPVNISPAARQQITATTETSLKLAEQQLQKNPNDVHALYARGVARGLRATYQGLVERSWFAALR